MMSLERCILTFGLFTLLLSAAATVARGGEIVTLQGKTFVGDLSLVDGAIEIKPANGQAIDVDPRNVLHATIALSPVMNRGIELTSGEVIAVDSIEKLDDSAVQVTRDGKPLLVPTERVARLIFRPISAAMNSRISAGQVGVLLDSGDFFQGEVRDLNSNRVKADSVLFGVQNFELTSQVLAIVLRDASTPPVSSKRRSVIRDTRGSLFLAAGLKATRGHLVFDDAQLGAIDLSLEQLAAIDAGSAMFRSLADLEPSDGKREDFQVDRTIAGVPMSLVDFKASRGIAQRPGSAVSWRLNGSAQSFVVTVGVPSALLPVGAVRFVVLADGREVARSKALSSVDDPQSLAVDLTGATTITLQVEAPSIVLGLEGLWANPECVNR